MIMEIVLSNDKKWDGEVGNILVSCEMNTHLVISNDEGFEVFDLDINAGRIYNSLEEFNEEFPIIEEYTPDHKF